MKTLTLRRGRTVRVGPWRARADVASLATYIDQPLDEAGVREAVGHLEAEHYTEIITGALSPTELPAFLAAGFEVARELVLLERTLDEPLPRPKAALRRSVRSGIDEAVDIDRDAFESFWQLDRMGIREAMSATPHRHLRLSGENPPAGYAISGVAAEMGYLQRLAVRPAAAGKGLGSALLLDGLRWMRRRGAERAVVNTQQNNERALALYERHGFKPMPAGLSILRRRL